MDVNYENMRVGGKPVCNVQNCAIYASYGPRYGHPLTCRRHTLVNYINLIHERNERLKIRAIDNNRE